MSKLMDGLDLLSGVFRATNGFRVLLNSVSPPIPELERDILNNLRKCIDDKYMAIFDEHVGKVNYTQLQSANRLTVLFQWKFPGWYDWKRDQYFEPQEGTKKLLNFKVVFENDQELHGNLVSIDGVFCNISYSEDIHFFKKSKIRQVIAKSGIIKKKVRN